MKRMLAVLALSVSLASTAIAVDQKSLLLGIAIAAGFQAVPLTRTHVVQPMVHAIQRAVRPVPQDAADREAKKQRKAEQKASRRHRRGLD
jgi:hypothetical protein